MSSMKDENDAIPVVTPDVQVYARPTQAGEHQSECFLKWCWHGAHLSSRAPSGFLVQDSGSRNLVEMDLNELFLLCLLHFFPSSFLAPLSLQYFLSGEYAEAQVGDREARMNTGWVSGSKELTQRELTCQQGRCTQGGKE